MDNKSKPVPILFDTYLALIQNSLGTKMFRNFYAIYEDKKQDLTQNGDLACAFYVSFVLHNFGLTKEPHLTVNGTQKDMEESGWERIEQPKPGVVIIWASREFDDGPHKHIGFAISDNQAVSTNSQTGEVYQHEISDDSTRLVESLWWHSSLSS